MSCCWVNLGLYNKLHAYSIIIMNIFITKILFFTIFINNILIKIKIYFYN